MVHKIKEHVHLLGQLYQVFVSLGLLSIHKAMIYAQDLATFCITQLVKMLYKNTSGRCH